MAFYLMVFFCVTREVCNGIAAMKQGLQAWQREASWNPLGGLNVLYR